MRYSTSGAQTAQGIYERGMALGVDVTNADREATVRNGAKELNSLLNATATHKPKNNPDPSPK